MGELDPLGVVHPSKVEYQVNAIISGGCFGEDAMAGPNLKLRGRRRRLRNR